jgi:hypothetical protein
VPVGEIPVQSGPDSPGPQEPVAEDSDACRDARADLARRIDQLLNLIPELSAKEIARAARLRTSVDREGLTDARLSDWRHGRNVPRRIEHLRAVVAAVAVEARRRGVGVPLDLGENALWIERWLAARSRRSAPAQRAATSAEAEPHTPGVSEPRFTGLIHGGHWLGWAVVAGGGGQGWVADRCVGLLRRVWWGRAVVAGAGRLLTV